MYLLSDPLPSYYSSRIINLNTSQPFTTMSFVVPKTDIWSIYIKADIDNGFVDTVIKTVQPYGLLPATDYPKLPFYGFESLAYLLVAVTWTVLAFLRKDNILPVQLYCTAITWAVLAESSIHYGYYRYFNTHGYSCKRHPIDRHLV
jgi:hypothetical protein